MARVYAIDNVIPVVHPDAFVHPTAVLIGDVHVGPGCYIAPGASLRGDIGRIEVHAGANIQDNCTLHCFPRAACVVGVEGHIGHGTVLHGARIGPRVLIGMNSVIMDDAEIGDAAIVGAMSFVKAGARIPPRSLWAGIPAKRVRDLLDTEIAWKARGTAEYQEIARRSLATLRAVEPLVEAEQDRPTLPVEAHLPLHRFKD
ncbi:transferase hexapeptide repeat family protein [Magnetospira sp. QH-2]|uniref:acyltransferase n=1 Tax=Magnetospira sp. (strain QH-2) TaxID=1288970 RepID=UPI0003E8102C|nr:transferase hexapeptide repeat family protein [Magnetospira sp. QH-2]CCQ75400.1 putative hexapeptide repeat acetyltransferase [Magnetospira sp. QH-2]